MEEITEQKWYQKTWFIVLMLIFLAPIGLIMMWVQGKFDKKVRIGITVVLVPLILINLFITPQPENNNTSSTLNNNKINEIKNNDTKTSQSPIEAIREFINEELGEKSNRDNPRIRTIKDGGSQDSLVVELNADDNLTSNYIKLGVLDNSKKIFNKAFKDRKEINEVNLIWYFSFKDIKGNSIDKPLISISLKRKTAETINWDNIQNENIPKVADSYYEHPSLKSE